MYYVYLLQSLSNPSQYYIGTTDNVERRIKAHNAGSIGHTAKLKPWEVVIFVAFKSKERAYAFERYLKSGSGHEFSRRHFK